ncbi:MAG: flagellar assembly peptidoglycan hydrolase FlgJ [Oleiphilaceae bacterium]|nr:flagellar assembly peptidoglycan hydrolase FlgJ [Oleiphilaceae bacterium]
MISSSNPHQAQSSDYNDFSSLNKLRGRVDSDPEGALKEVARQFESLFLHEMLKTMRQANAVFAEDNYLHSNETEFYQEMFDEQLTQSMTQSRSIGIADALVRQLGGEPRQARPGNEQALGRSIQNYDRSMPPLSQALPKRLEEVERLADSPAEKAAEPVPELPARFDSPRDFVRKLLPLAKEASGDSGISPRLMVAQAALETGWGRHMIEGEGGSPSHNLFGIKADSRWGGDSVVISTTEFRDGVPMSEKASFRAYGDYRQSFSDYVQFLNENPRYQQVLSQAHDPDAFARGLREAGYATDPEYDRKIRGIMDGPILRSALDEDSTGENP